MSQEIPDRSAKKLLAGNSFCILPWVHCHVTTSGIVNACAVSSTRFGDLRHNTLSEVWHGDAIRKFRAQHLSGEKVQGCEYCYVAEQAGQRSIRQNANVYLGARGADWVDATDAQGDAPLSRPIDYDIRFSNICNLKCRSCGHDASSSWFLDMKAVYGVTQGPNAIIRAFDTSSEFWRAFDGFVDDVEKIMFAGGEPLLIDEHYEVLRALHERSKFDVFIYYHTNFSTLEHRGIQVTSFWRDFRNLYVAASLDGSGARGEVLRNGLSWPKVLANRERLRRECPNVKFRVTCTVGALNAWHLPDFHRELIDSGFIVPEEFELNVLQTPEHLSSQVLPLVLKEEIAAKIRAHIAWLQSLGPERAVALEKVIEQYEALSLYMCERDASRNIPQLRNFCQTLDGLRGEDSGEVFPELAALGLSRRRKPGIRSLNPFSSSDQSRLAR
jgi:MoaA/NifB/PqqE/SkfB family radical SAM enzyme